MRGHDSPWCCNQRRTTRTGIDASIPPYRTVQKQGEAPLISRATTVPWQSPRTKFAAANQDDPPNDISRNVRRSDTPHRRHARRNQRVGPAERPNETKREYGNETGSVIPARLINTRINHEDTVRSPRVAKQRNANRTIPEE